jgi:polysaccharide deacetylase family protein (PEP-CTERM system associated)
MSTGVHALSVDVEDWSNVALLLNFGRVVPPQPAVVRNTERMLALFQAHGAKATWFILGEVAAAFPGLVRQLAEAGQEIGVHGYHHHPVYTLKPTEFRDDLRRAKEAVEQAAGQPVLGYRATAFSITRETPWAFEVVAELGFKYDSSVFPFQGRRYGMPESPLTPYRLTTRAGELWEVPLSVVEWGGRRLPCCGGGYLRHFPLWYTRWAMRRLERAGRRAVFYFHPVEIDPEFDKDFFARHLSAAEQRRFRRVRFLQHRNRAQTATKLHWLLSHYRFASLTEAFELTSPATV